jgi:hypothetical protein
LPNVPAPLAATAAHARQNGDCTQFLRRSQSTLATWPTAGNTAVWVTSLSPLDTPNIDTAGINTDAHMPPRHRITLMQTAFLSAASIFRIGASE